MNVNSTDATSVSTLNGLADNDVFNIRGMDGPVNVRGGDDNESDRGGEPLFNQGRRYVLSLPRALPDGRSESRRDALARRLRDAGLLEDVARRILHPDTLAERVRHNRAAVRARYSLDGLRASFREILNALEHACQP